MLVQCLQQLSSNRTRSAVLVYVASLANSVCQINVVWGMGLCSVNKPQVAPQVEGSYGAKTFAQSRICGTRQAAK